MEKNLAKVKELLGEINSWNQILPGDYICHKSIYLSIDDLGPVLKKYKQVYDLLECPTIEEIEKLIEENLHITHECYEYLYLQKEEDSSSELLILSELKELLKDKEVRKTILLQVNNRVFNTEDKGYDHYSKTFDILRTKGYKYIDLILEANEELIAECDLDIRNNKISIDSYTRITNTMNNGIEKLMFLCTCSQKKNLYEDFRSYSLRYPSTELVAPIEGFFLDVCDDTSLYPTEKQFQEAREKFNETYQEEGKRLSKADII